MRVRAATQALFLTLWARLTQIVICVNQIKSGEYCNDENLIKAENSSVLHCSVNALSS